MKQDLLVVNQYIKATTPGSKAHRSFVNLKKILEAWDEKH